MKRLIFILVAICGIVLVVQPASAKLVCKSPKHPAPVMVKKRIHKHGKWVVVKSHGKVVWIKQRKKQHGKWVVVQHCVKPQTTKQVAAAKKTVATPAPVQQSAPAPAAPAPSAPVTTTVGIGGALDQLGNCSGSLGTSVVRIILFNYEPQNRFLQCAQNEVANGHRLIISIQYGNDWSIQQDQSWFTTAMQMYAPLHPMEVSVGNEQFFDAAGSGQHYSDVFKAVGPIIKAYDPTTLLGAGEVDPWWPGMNKLEAALKAGLPGMQVLAGHIYPDHNEGWQPSVLLDLAHTYHAMTWATEGLCGTGSWVNYGCRPMSAVAGYNLAVVWYVPTS